MTKPINIRDVPSNYEELLEYVPRSQYTRNAVTQNRVISRLSSEQSLVGKYQPNYEAVFRIPASTQTLLNLAECYFSITGTMTLPTITGSLTYPALKAGPLFLLKMLNKISIDIGGVCVHSITTPAVLAKLYESLAINYNDKEHGDLINDGFHTGVDKCNYFGDLEIKDASIQTWKGVTKNNFKPWPGKYQYIGGSTGHTDTTAANAAAGITEPGMPKDSIFYIGVSANSNGTGVTQGGVTAGTSYLVYQFKVNLQLKDVFPIETMKPIFGQSVVVRCNFESKGFTGILSSTGISPQIQSFEQFYLNVYQYNINSEMQHKLQQIYSKPVVEIIDAIDKQVQTIPAINENSDVQLFVPLATQFENSCISVFMPHCLSNNANDGLVMQNATSKLMNLGTAKNFTQHTPMDYRFMNINRLQIISDGSVVYERSFNESSFPATTSFNLYDSPLQPLVTNIGSTQNPQSLAYTDLTTVPLNDYSNLYELYKQCRCYFDVTEDSCVPFNEWLYSCFAVTVPTSCFTRLTTGSQIVLSINFGPGMKNEPTYKTASAPGAIGINERITSVNAGNITTEALKQVVIYQRYKKALVYQGFNNCSVKTITQSFEQDIEVNEPMPGTANAN